MVQKRVLLVSSDFKTKIHIQFCKIMLNAKNEPLIMLSSQLGRLPISGLKLFIIKILLYTKCIDFLLLLSVKIGQRMLSPCYKNLVIFSFGILKMYLCFLSPKILKGDSVINLSKIVLLLFQHFQDGELL